MSLFTHLFTHSHPSHALIAPHPRLRSLRNARVFSLIFMALILVITVITLIARVILRRTAFPWPPLFFMLILLCGIGFSFVIERWWKPLEALRLAAAQGDHRLLAKEQPRPNPEAQDVPVKIIMHLSRKGLFVSSLFWFLLLSGLADANFLLDEWVQHSLDSSTWLWLLAMVAAVGMVMAFVLAVGWQQCWVIEVRQEGIRSWVNSLGMAENGVSSMSWHEVRLFACYREPHPWNKDSTLIYELSSASQVVLWTWVQKKEPLCLSLVPIIPFEHYQAQMRAICDLVATKTGLPLYDLSTQARDQTRRSHKE